MVCCDSIQNRSAYNTPPKGHKTALKKLINQLGEVARSNTRKKGAVFYYARYGDRLQRPEEK